MPRKIIKRYLPHPHRITQNPLIKGLGPRLHDPGLWHINRRSVSGAFAIGLFFTFMPIPFQMVPAAISAILFRVNILIAMPTVWISNPVTIPPLFYFCYKVGGWILDTPPGDFKFDLSFHWLANELTAIWQPFLLGCFVVASISSLAGYLFVRGIWRFHIWQHIIERRQRNKS